jgi:hypothetical protein
MLDEARCVKVPVVSLSGVSFQLSEAWYWAHRLMAER